MKKCGKCKETKNDSEFSNDRSRKDGLNFYCRVCWKTYSSKYTITPEYRCWSAMKERCFNKNSKAYKSYGGRGITVCDRWRNSYKNFIEDVGLRPSNNHSIDRVDNDKNYEPGNCRWATRSEQQKNKRPSGTSKHKYVHFYKARNNWRATMRADGKKIHIGYYDTEDEAGEAVRKFLEEL